MTLEAFKVEAETKENTTSPEIADKSEGFKDLLNRARRCYFSFSRYDEESRNELEIKRLLREGGSELVDYVIGEVNAAIKDAKENGGRNPSNTIFHLTNDVMEYAATFADAEKIGKLVLDDAICLDADGSTKSNLLQILDRVGGKENIEQLRLAALKILQAGRNLESNAPTDQMRATDMAYTLLNIKHRLVDEKETEAVDRTLGDISNALMDEGYKPLTADWIQERSQRIQNSNLEERFEAEFVEHEVPPPRSTGSGHSMNSFDDGWDNWDSDPADRNYGMGSTRVEEEHISPEVREQIEKNIEKVDELTLKEEVAPTALPAIRLHMFNFLQKKPESSETELEEEFDRMKKLSDLEKKCAEKRNPLPTIGIEIEIPGYILTGQKLSILRSFSIPNHEEALDNLWEVNPDYSYSATTQSRIIQELGHLGAIPIDKGTKKVDSNEQLSMHVNFGMPEGITEKMLEKTKYKERIKVLNDLIIYAFTSPERLLARKTTRSLEIKNDALASEKGPKTQRNSRLSGNARLELRAGEFRDQSSFRMLTESQRLMAMLISYIKYAEKFEMTFAEACLA